MNRRKTIGHTLDNAYSAGRNLSAPTPNYDFKVGDRVKFVGHILTPAMPEYMGQRATIDFVASHGKDNWAYYVKVNFDGEHGTVGTYSCAFEPLSALDLLSEV